MNADEIIRHLRLQPHPKEDGFFVETYRSEERISFDALPGRYDGARALSTAIYFLLRQGGFSELHRLRSDEIFHYYLGSAAELLLLYSNGAAELIRLGTDLMSGERAQVIVPRGTWQGMRTTGEYTLMGTTVSPGFEYSDYESGNREELAAQYPAFDGLIRQLTR